MNLLPIITIIIWGLIGLIESFLLSVEAKFFQRNHIMGTRITTVMNTFIFLFILSSIFEYLSKIDIKIAYVIGVMEGNILAIKFDLFLVKLAKIKGFKLRKLFKHKKRKK